MQTNAKTIMVPKADDLAFKVEFIIECLVIIFTMQHGDSHSVI